MMCFRSLLLLTTFPLFLSVEAHPGHDHSHEVNQRSSYLNGSPFHKRSIAHCADKLRARGNHEKMMKRRHELAESLREKRSILHSGSYLKVRDLDDVLATDHHSNASGLSLDNDPATLFTGNSSCILTPEVTEGPYYITGEFVRKDVTESQQGVAMTLDIQIIDVNTCDPLPDVYLEIWNCNSTGVYSGVIANGNGDDSDSSNINATFLRGIQPSSTDGIVTFDTLVPGHYTGRTTHSHVMAHLNVDVLSNSTISGGTISHVGQLFYDQDLINAVTRVEPYSTNTQALTLNEDDGILAQEAEDVDPIVSYVYLGDSLADGILAWTSFGVDSGASKSVSVAVAYGENGGVANSNSGGGGRGGQGGPPPNGTVPSGGPPSNGTVPTGAVSLNGTSPTMTAGGTNEMTGVDATTTVSADAATGTSASATSNHAVVRRRSDAIRSLWASLLAAIAFGL